MDRLRRSIRQSFRSLKSKKKSPSLTGGDHSSSSQTQAPPSQQPPLWQSDEAAVRAGSCSFSVKYLGCTEVFESRGMQICEEALKQLRHSCRKKQRAVLHISGDGLRVVDATSSQLIVDQTIEKVSFCAPDRNHDRGFSYICRDGTTRRWLCHGFVAVRESGERLSHAVGCAFQICLEKKQKRDRETVAAASAATVEPNPSPSTPSKSAPSVPQAQPDIITVHTPVKSTSTPSGFATSTPIRPGSAVSASPSVTSGLTASSRTASQNGPSVSASMSTSFVRQSLSRSSIADRMRNPQEFKNVSPPPVPSPSAQLTDTRMKRDRPHVTPEMLQRQQSLRVFPQLKSATPFKRNLSLETRAEPVAVLAMRNGPTTPAPVTSVHATPASRVAVNTNVPTWEDGSPILETEENEENEREIARLCQQMSFDLHEMSSSTTSSQAGTPMGSPFVRYNGGISASQMHYTNVPKSMSSPHGFERHSFGGRNFVQEPVTPPKAAPVYHYVNGTAHQNSGSIRYPLTVEWTQTAAEPAASSAVHDPFNADWVNVQKGIHMASSTTNPFLT